MKTTRVWHTFRMFPWTMALIGVVLTGGQALTGFSQEEATSEAAPAATKVTEQKADLAQPTATLAYEDEEGEEERGEWGERERRREHRAEGMLERILDRVEEMEENLADRLRNALEEGENPRLVFRELLGELYDSEEEEMVELAEGIEERLEARAAERRGRAREEGEWDERRGRGGPRWGEEGPPRMMQERLFDAIREVAPELAEEAQEEIEAGAFPPEVIMGVVERLQNSEREEARDLGERIEQRIEQRMEQRMEQMHGNQPLDEHQDMGERRGRGPWFADEEEEWQRGRGYGRGPAGPGFEAGPGFHRGPGYPGMPGGRHGGPGFATPHQGFGHGMKGYGMQGYGMRGYGHQRGMGPQQGFGYGPPRGGGPWMGYGPQGRPAHPPRFEERRMERDAFHHELMERMDQLEEVLEDIDERLDDIMDEID